MQEQRRYARHSSEAIVEITHPSLGIIEYRAKDLSDGGVYVFFGNNVVIPVGTDLNARIKRHSGVINQQPIAMQVVRHGKDGMGLMFV